MEVLRAATRSALSQAKDISWFSSRRRATDLPKTRRDEVEPMDNTSAREKRCVFVGT